MAIKTTAATLLIMAALVAVVAPRIVLAGGANVDVTATIAPTITATVVDGGVRVLANTPWQLSVTATDDEASDTLVFEGDRTGAKGSTVSVEGMVRGFTLVPR